MCQKSLIIRRPSTQSDQGAFDSRVLRASIVHDFNNLLMPIINVLSELQRQQVGTPRQWVRIEGAMFCAFRASALARQLLDISELGHFSTEPVAVASLITPIDAALAGLMHSVRCMIDLPDDLPDALVDRGLMERALLNLAINSRDAMPGGGTLKISGSVEMRDTATAPMIRVLISDTGCGIAPEAVEQIMKGRFSSKRHGNGLGLAMVRSVMERQGGDLMISSMPGQGTTIELWLPIAGVVKDD